MSYCVVLFCLINKNKASPEERVSFHEFPSNLEKRTRWFKTLPKKTSVFNVYENNKTIYGPLIKGIMNKNIKIECYLRSIIIMFIHFVKKNYIFYHSFNISKLFSIVAF